MDLQGKERWLWPPWTGSWSPYWPSYAPSWRCAHVTMTIDQQQLAFQGNTVNSLPLSCWMFVCVCVCVCVCVYVCTHISFTLYTTKYKKTQTQTALTLFHVVKSIYKTSLCRLMLSITSHVAAVCYGPRASAGSGVVLCVCCRLPWLTSSWLMGN